MTFFYLCDVVSRATSCCNAFYRKLVTKLVATIFHLSRNKSPATPFYTQTVFKQ